ncbi:NUMOD4 domain-containing protein [Bacillus cereus]|nr:NUMOD4 domain-containing protein [Bacillus cereus]MEC3259296.1 NUMOD4 domain-containing protein [Bacillus cereus]
MTEIWKDIEGYEGLYQVSNLGRVKSLARCVLRGNKRNLKVRERILKSSIRGTGYERINLYDEGVRSGIYVHRLVAQTFLYKKDGADEVNHKDGNKLNNESSNLEWVTGEENIEHAFREGLHVSPRKSVHMLTLRGNHVMTFPSATEATKYLGKSSSGGIINVCKGRNKTAYGYKWKYASEGDLL